MIVYFADREMQVLGHASTNLPDGYVIIEDLKTEDVETGVATFGCKIGYNKENRLQLERMTNAGNYLLRSHDNENEFYTIIDTEIDTRNQSIYVYAEDAGLDLLNEIAGEYEADETHNAEWYINKYIIDSGFEIGINEIPADTTRKLSWEGEETVTARLASIATQFGGYEISYSFDIKGLIITNKYVNIHKERGKDAGVQLRLNIDVDRIVTTKSVANLATAFVCEGGVPDNAEDPITLKGYTVEGEDAANFFIDDNGVLKAKSANEKWSRYVWNKEPNQLKGYEGYIVRTYSYNTTEQKTLCSHAITELKKVCDIEVNYEIDINRLPEGVQIGDRVNIIDDAGELYVSTRVLKLETSIVDDTYKATLGDHIIKTSGISQRVAELAAQFAKSSQSAARALTIATNAQTKADEAQAQANAVAEEVATALEMATEAQKSASAAVETATNAQAEAQAAQAAVSKVESSVSSLETTVTEAKAAADNAEKAAEDATALAGEAKTAASNAQTEAGEAKTASGEAKTKAESAITQAGAAISTANTAKTNAESAIATAEAAKLDAEQAEKDVAALGESLETVRTTMSTDYARKTELTETTANLQTQISQNAAEISSTAAMVLVIDETANDAKEKAEAAQSAAGTAQAQADQATAEALAAQNAANAADAAAKAAQAEADTAKAAAEAAQGIADKAEADLEAAKADLATVAGRVDATEEEISAAQEAVTRAQTAAENAKADADAAALQATNAQTTANTAVTNAANAQTAANNAATQAALAQQTADEAKGDASAAQAKANEAANTAAEAQRTADTAVSNAATAQAKADQAALNATTAQQAADAADAKAAQAQTDLNNAKQNLADVTSRVGATEEEVAAAQAAVATAQQAANLAKEEAEAAQSTADTAKADASKAQTDANNAKTAADNAQAKANEAQQAANEAQAAVDSLAVRVTTAETKITQNSEKIELCATKTEVDAIAVGGRNLFPDTDFDGVSKRYERRSGNSSEGGFYFYPITQIESGIDYTIGAKIRGNANLVFYEINEGGNMSHDWIKRDELNATEYRYFSLTFSIGSDRKFKHAFICTQWGDANTLVGDWFEIEPCSLKLEKGNKATDWSPAPEDVDSKFLDYATKTEMEAAIKVQADSITSSVKATYTTKEEAAAATEKAYAKATSKGEQLVANGTGLLGDNTNFSSWTFDGANANNSPGSFTMPAGHRGNLFTDEYIPLDSQKEYTLTFDAKSLLGVGTIYAMLDFYDADENRILAGNHIYIAGTTTKLARDLVAGDTVAYVEDLSKWVTNKTYHVWLAFWNQKNSFGYTYPVETYTRNRWQMKHSNNLPTSDALDYANNCITLHTAYTGATIPAGTELSQGGDGSSYKYLIFNQVIPTEWQTFSGKIKGVDYSGTNISTMFPPGTAYAKIGYLWNYNNSAGEQLWITNVTVQDTTSINEAKDAAEVAKENAYKAQKSANEAQSTIDNLEIGGRNLLKNGEYGAVIGDDWTELVMPATGYYSQFGSSTVLEAGQTYTFSIIVEKVSTDDVPINLHCGSGSLGSYNRDYTAWQVANIPFGTKIVVTFTVPENIGTTYPYFAWRLRNEKKATTIRFKNAQLERGHKASDWTPALEDVNQSIENSAELLRQTITEKEASILTTAETNIMTAVETSYVKNADYTEFKETTQATLTELPDQIGIKFTEVKEYADTVNNEVRAIKENLEKHFDFSMDGLTIRAGESSMTLTLDNDEIVFTKNGEEFGRWVGDTFKIKKIHIGSVSIEAQSSGSVKIGTSGG